MAKNPYSTHNQQRPITYCDTRCPLSGVKLEIMKLAYSSTVCFNMGLGILWGSQIELERTCSAPQCTLQTHSNTWSVSAVEAVNTLLTHYNVHTTVCTAKPMQPTCSPCCTYTARTPYVHSSSIWDSLKGRFIFQSS